MNNQLNKKAPRQLIAFDVFVRERCEPAPNEHAPGRMLHRRDAWLAERIEV
jgi:hypothetical protein